MPKKSAKDVNPKYFGTVEIVVDDSTTIKEQHGDGDDDDDDDDDGGGVKQAIQLYWESWLQQDSSTLQTLLASNHRYLLISQQTGRRFDSTTTATDARRDDDNNAVAVSEIWQSEWSAYEKKKKGKKKNKHLIIAMQIQIVNLQIELRGEDNDDNETDVRYAKCTYKMNIKGGMRWTYEDTVAVTQFFIRDKVDGDERLWKLCYHADSWGIEDVAKFHFDYVYPCQNLQRAKDFYSPLLGPPEFVTDATSITWNLKGHRFILDTDDLDGYAQPKLGVPNGYAIFHVPNIAELSNRLRKQQQQQQQQQQQGTGGCKILSQNQEIQIHPITGDKFLLVADPSGNVLVLRQVVTETDSQVQGQVTFDAPQQQQQQKDPPSPQANTTIDTMKAWLSMDMEKLSKALSRRGEGGQDNDDDDNNNKNQNNTTTTWFDDTTANGRHRGVLEGCDEICQFVQEQHATYYDHGKNKGLAADLKLSQPIEFMVGTCWKIVSFRHVLVGKGKHPYKTFSWLTQVFDKTTTTTTTTSDDDWNISSTTIIRSNVYATSTLEEDDNNATTPPLVEELDYVGYPVTTWKQTLPFYRDILDLGEPYQDVDWNGFWSTQSVFGLYMDEDQEDDDSTAPRQRHQKQNGTNGYISFWIHSTQATYEYLKRRNCDFPLLPAINGQKGIDCQPGYNQILATDSEGSALIFSQYTGR